MTHHDHTYQELAATLTLSDHFDAATLDLISCEPLELLVALHQEVRSAMLDNPARAGRAANAARRVAERFPNNPLHFAQAHWSAGSAILFLPDYVGALAHYDAALNWYGRAQAYYAPLPPPRDIRAVHTVRIFCLSELGSYREALEAVHLATMWLQEHPDAYVELTLLLNRSQLAGRMGNYGAMLTLADETIALAIQLDHTDRAAQGWLNRANACIFLGRYADAADAVDHAQKLAVEAEEALTTARARVCRAWLMHMQGHLFAALTELRVATDMLRQAPGENATVLLEEATILAQLRQWPEALSAARQAATLYANQDLAPYSLEAALQATVIAVRLGQVRTAQQLVERARLLFQPGVHALLEARLALTEALVATLPTLEQPTALRRLRQHARVRASQALVVLEEAGLELAVAEGKLIESALYAQLGRTADAVAGYSALARHPNDIIQLEAHGALGTLLPAQLALAHLETATELAVIQRRTLPMEELQARYSGETAIYHMRLAICALELGLPERAAAVIWEAKAGSILDLRAAGANDEPHIRELIAESKATLSRLGRLVEEHSRMARLASGDEQHELAAYHMEQSRVASAEAQAQALALTAHLRTLADRGGQREVPDFVAVQSALTPKSALLEWFQVGGVLWVMLLLSEGAPTFHHITDTRTIARLLDRWSLVAHRYQGAAQQAGAAMIAQTLLPISSLLFAPMAEKLVGLEALIVAPCDLLFQLPWVALSRTLGERLTVTLTPSGGLWASPPEAPTGPIGAPRILGAASEGSGRLANVQVELDAISACLPLALVKLEASVADLRTDVTPLILHLACHGHTNAAAPLCSTLELADAPFLLLEAHRLNLRGTALVVLSACETSVRPDHGDIVLALAGAFLCAGAAAVVASLWRVDDAATAALMGAFYAGLADGLAPDIALQQAQAALRDRYPLDWAAFQLWVGAASVARTPVLRNGIGTGNALSPISALL